MKKEEADKKAKEIFRELSEKHDEIVREAKLNGTWRSGLDANRKLFVEIDNEYRQKILDLAAQIDE